jgi:hypothetical protein
MHSEIETLERIKLLRDVRKSEYDVLIGINLLREGLDLPEVSLVAVLDADKEAFLRSQGSLIQTSLTAHEWDAITPVSPKNPPCLRARLQPCRKPLPLIR